MKIFVFSGTENILGSDRATRKINQFKGFAHGWYYGEGDPPTTETVKNALMLNNVARSFGLINTNAFPGLDGEIRVVIYIGEADHSFTISNDAITYTEEIDEEEVESIKFLTKEKALSIIRMLGSVTKWNTSDYFTLVTTMNIEKDSLAKPSNLMMVESQLSNLTVSNKLVTDYVYTSGNIMVNQQLENLHYSGYFPTTYSQTTQ